MAVDLPMKRMAAAIQLPVYRYKKSGRLIALEGGKTAIGLTQNYCFDGKPPRHLISLRPSMLEVAPVMIEVEITSMGVNREYTFLRTIPATLTVTTNDHGNERQQEKPAPLRDTFSSPPSMNAPKKIIRPPKISLGASSKLPQWLGSRISRGANRIAGLLLPRSWALRKWQWTAAIALLAWENMSPEAFESAAGKYLGQQGYRVGKTPFRADGGIDLILHNRDDKRTLVQVKRHKSNVGVATVREIIGAAKGETDAPALMVLALNDFTKGARRLAERHGVTLLSVRHDILGL